MATTNKRNTRQQQVVRGVFLNSPRPLNAGEVLRAARRKLRALGIATVYRQIKNLHTEGLLQPVEIPGQAIRYELSGKVHHHHFQCRNCDSVFEIEGCPGNLDPLLPKDFTLEGHTLLLHGLCQACKSA